MGKSIFVDLTRCTACRGCQIACKQWKDLPGEDTKQLGTHQNPPDLSFNTIRLVRFTEAEVNGKLEWLFFPEQCRHCIMPPCKATADMTDEGAILQDEATGAVHITEKIMAIGGDDMIAIQASCPYNIPRIGKDGKGASKCDFCFDRITNGMPPACVLACPTGTMNYGEEEEMLALAKKRLEHAKKKYPDAVLGDPDSVRVIYLFQTAPKTYYKNAVSELSAPPLTRKEFFASLMGKKA